MNANELAEYIQDAMPEAATMLRQQQAELDALKKFKVEADALDKKLFESIKKSNEMWDRAAESLLKKTKNK